MKRISTTVLASTVFIGTLCTFSAYLNAAHAQIAAPGQAPVLTRLVRIFMDQEAQLLQAVKDKNADTLEKALAFNFEMRTANRPGTPVPRGDWIKSAVSQGGGDFSIQQMSVQEVGNVAIASFVLTPTAQNKLGSPAFIVDTWVPEGEGWKLRARHASAVLSAATHPKSRYMMGDAEVSIDEKKKY